MNYGSEIEKFYIVMQNKVLDKETKIEYAKRVIDKLISDGKSAIVLSIAKNDQIIDSKVVEYGYQRKSNEAKTNNAGNKG